MEEMPLGPGPPQAAARQRAAIAPEDP